MESVRPISPPAAYIGGKRLLAKQITPLIDAIDHDTYAEPFVGMGGVFFRRSMRPRAEAINDFSRDVANLFRILQRHYAPFSDMLRFGLSSRAEFERLQAVDPETQTDLERAARFLYLQRLTFGGKVAGQTFGIDPGRPARFSLTRLEPILEAVHDRLCDVTIECLRWQDFLTRYDRPGTLFYLDPPYWGSEDYYGKAAFTRDEFVEMGEILSAIKGRFILSINDTPGVRKIFGGRFTMTPVATKYTVNGSSPQRSADRRELIITPKNQ